MLATCVHFASSRDASSRFGSACSEVAQCPSAPGQKGNKPSKQLAAIDQLLIAGIKQGPAKKRDAINRILELVPGWTRGDCWQRIRHLRKTAELAGLAEGHSTRAKKSGETRRSPTAALHAMDTGAR